MENWGEHSSTFVIAGRGYEEETKVFFVEEKEPWLSLPRNAPNTIYKLTRSNREDCTQTDTGRLVENTKEREWTLSKELGKPAP